MFEKLSAAIGGEPIVLEGVLRTYAADRLIMTGAVTVVVGSTNVPPFGLSIKRILQRRCVLVLTDQRIVIQSVILAHAVWLYAFLAGLAVAFYTSTGEFVYLFVAAVFSFFLIQRRPFFLGIPLSAIIAVEYHQVLSGVVGTTGLVRIVCDSDACDVVMSSPESMDELVIALKKWTHHGRGIESRTASH